MLLAKDTKNKYNKQLTDRQNLGVPTLDFAVRGFIDNPKKHCVIKVDPLSGLNEVFVYGTGEKGPYKTDNSKPKRDIDKKV